MPGRGNGPRVTKLWNSLNNSRAMLMSNAITLMDAYAEFTKVKVQDQDLPLLGGCVVSCLCVEAVYLQIWGLISFEGVLGFHRKLISRTNGTMISIENANAFRTLLYEHSSNSSSVN